MHRFPVSCLAAAAALALALAAPAVACPNSEGSEGPATSSAAAPSAPETSIAASWERPAAPLEMGETPAPGHHEDAEPAPSGPETGEEGRQGG